MSATVDTRVVEAKFDAKDFEKGVNKTIKKLDELKQSLNLKDGSKSITDFAKKTEEATEKSSSSLKKLEERLTSFTGMVKQQILGGLANEVSSVFTRIQSSLTGFIDSLSSQQIRSGMQRYTDILTSVRTLTAAGTDQGAAYESIERLGMYADQTSYSLDELVSTMSKFKTAGASLETAQRMVEGLSNAAASMGVNAQQAQRAYLNMQQAYSKGYMMQNDWISFESLPMVGEKFNQAILDAAVKAGTLVKQKNGTYKTSSKVDKKVRSASGITAQNLGSNLASRWFNKSVMEEVFGNTYYFSDIDPNEVNELKNVEKKIKDRVKNDPALKYEDLMQEELDKRYQERRKTKVEELDKELKEEKITQKEYDEILKEFDKENHMSVFSWEAFRAGQEARSLTDVLNTLKDTISRGWATSFEHIFGKLDEAADFFTKLTESNFATAIYKIGEFRNAVLSIWSGNDDSDNSGRKMLIESLKMIDEIVGDIMVKLQIITEDGEDGEGFKRNAQSLGATLNNVSKKIRDGVAAFKDWLNSPIYKDGPSRIDAFIQALRNLLSVWDVIKAAISAAGSIINGKNIGSVLDMLTNIILPLSSAIAQLSERLVPIINTLAENIKFPISDSLSNLNKVIQNIMQPLNQITGILADIAAFFAEMALGTIESNIRFFSDLFGGFLELIGMESSQKENGRGVIDGFTKSLQEFGDTLKSGAKAIKEFFDALFNDLRTLFGLTEDTENEGFLSNLTKFFGENESLKNIKNWIDKAVKDIGNWIKNIPNRLSEYAVKIGDFFRGLFFTKQDIVKGVNANGERVINTVEVKTELTIWLEKAVKDIKDWIADIPNKLKAMLGDVGDLIGTVLSVLTGKGNFLKRKDTSVANTGSIKVQSEFDKWLDGIIKDIKDWLLTIPEKLASIPSLIGEVIRGLFVKTETNKTETVLANGRTLYKTETVEVETALGKWLRETVDSVKDWIKDIPNKLITLAGNIGDIIQTIVDFFLGKKTSIANTDKTVRVQSEFDKWLDKAKKDALAWITDIPNKVKKIPSIISSFVSALFYDKKKKETVLKNGRTLYKTETVMKPWVASLTNGVKNFIKNIPTYVQQAIQGAGDFLKTIWTSIFGGGNQNESEATDEVEDIIAEPFLNISIDSILTWISDLGSKIWNGILSIFTGTTDPIENQNKLATGVSDAINWIETKANQAWTSVREWFLSLPTKIANFFNGKDTTAGGNDPKTEVKSSIGSLAETVGIAISNIPNDILTFVEDLATNMKPVWDKVTNALLGKDSPRDARREIENFKKENREQITGIAEAFTDTGTGSKEHPIVTNFRTFFERIIKDIGDITSGLPEAIVNGLNSGVDFIGGLANKVSEWFAATNEEIQKETLGKSAEEVAETIEGSVDAVSEKAGEGIEKDGPSPLLTAIISFGQKIRDLITVTIPEMFKQGFDFVRNNTEWFADKTTNFLFGKDFDKFIEEDVTKFGEDIKKKIIALPANITKGFNFVTSLIDSLFNTDNDYTFMQKQTDETYQNILREGGFGAAERYWSDWHPPFFTALWNNLKEMFSTIGQPILDGINIAIDWLNTKIGDITTFMSDIHLDGGSVIDTLNEQMVDNKGEVNPVWESIRKIGLSIKTFMVETIPNFIKEAVKEISLKIPSILGGLFGEGSFLSDIFGFDSEEAEESTGVKKELSKAESMVQGFQNLYNQMREITGLNIIESFFGKDTSSSFKELKNTEKGIKLANNFIDVYESTKNRINKSEGVSLMGIVGSIFGIGTAFGESSENDEMKHAGRGHYFGEAEENLQSAVDWAGTLNTGLQSIFSIFDHAGSALESKTVQTTVLLFVIGKLLETLQETISITDELDALKSVAIAAAFGGIVALMGYITYIATQGTPEQIRQVEGIFNNLKDLLTIVAVIAGLWKGLDLIKTLSESDVAKYGLGGGLLSSLITGLAVPTGIAVGGDILSTGFDKTMENLSSGFSELGAGVITLLEFIQPAVTSLATLAGQLDDAIAAIGKVKTLVGELITLLWSDIISDDETVNQAFQNIKIGGFIKAFDANADLFLGIGAFVKGITEAAKNMSDLETLKNNISTFTSFVQTGEFVDFLSAVNTAMTQAFKGAFETLGEHDSNKFAELSSYFLVLGEALNLFTGGFDGITQENVNAVKDAFKLINELGTGLVNEGQTGQSFLNQLLNGDKSLGNFGSNISQFGIHMKTFFNAISDIKGTDDAAYESTKRKVELVIDIAQGMALAASRLKYYENDIKDVLADSGNALPEFGLKVGEFMVNMDKAIPDTISTDRLLALNTTVSVISGLLDTLTNSFDLLTKSDMPITEVINNLWTELSAPGKSEQLAADLRRVFDIAFAYVDLKIPISANSFSLTDDAIQKLVTDLNTALQLEENELTPTISPVIKLSEDSKSTLDQIREVIGFKSNTPINFGYNNSGMKLQLDNGTPQIIMKDYTSNLNMVISEISDLRKDISTLATNFSNMGVILRSGPLVGAIGPDIDTYLGEVGYIKSRTQ